MTSYTNNETDFTHNNEVVKGAESKYSNIHVADWASVANSSFYSAADTIHPTENGGLKAWIDTIKGALSVSCSAGLLPGNDNIEKIWNAAVKANIDGMSDNPAAISGMIGNIIDESGGKADPFAHNAGSDYWGIIQYYDPSGNTGYVKEINDAGLGQYWGNGSTAPQEAVDKALQIEIEWVLKKNARVVGGTVEDGTSWKADWAFIPNIGKVDKNEPENYAELWLVTVEGAYDAPSVQAIYPDRLHMIEDSWALKIAKEIVPSTSGKWQDTDRRREYAREVYDKYAGYTSPMSPDEKIISPAGFTKYDLTDTQLWDLAEVAMSENNCNLTAFKNEVSIMANIFEDPARNNTINGDNFVAFIRNGGWFSTSGYVNGAVDFEVDTEHMKTIKDILLDGNRTLPLEIVEHDCLFDSYCTYGIGWAYSVDDTNESNDLMNNPSGWQSGKVKLVQKNGVGERAGEWIFYGWTGGETGVCDPMGYYANRPPSSQIVQTTSESAKQICDTGGKHNSRGAARIAEVAALMSWPVQGWQTGADDYNASRIGKCSGGYLGWVDYQFDTAPCMTNPRDFYKNNVSPGLYGYLDCGVFVMGVLKYLGLVDATVAAGGQPYAGQNLRADPDWEEIENNGSEDNLRPGDVLWDGDVSLGGSGLHGHIIIYLGEKYGGDYGVIAHASAQTRVGEVSGIYSIGDWHIFRYVGDKLGSDEDENEDAHKIGNALAVLHADEDNNLSKTKIALANGFWAVECDLYTKNGIYECAHPDEGGTSYYKSGVSPSLEAVVNEAEKYGAKVILDDPVGGATLVNYIKQKGWQNTIIIQGGDPASYNGLTQWGLIGSWNNESTVDAYVSSASSNQGDGMTAVNIYEGLASNENIKKLKDAGYRVCVYTYNNFSQDQIKQYDAQGVEYLMVDDANA